MLGLVACLQVHCQQLILFCVDAEVRDELLINRGKYCYFLVCTLIVQIEWCTIGVRGEMVPYPVDKCRLMCSAE